MGGICGFFNFGSGRPAASEVLERMDQRQSHRGSPAADPWVRDRIALASRVPGAARAPGASPLASDPEGRRIAFSGEVFNRGELRAALQARGGRPPRDGSDAELVLRVYEACEEDWLQRINGQFALALWDQARDRLVLARDALGICPLHYAVADGELVFASDAKAVLAHPGVCVSVDEVAVAESLLCGTLFEGRTLFASVQRLDPGTALTVSSSGWRKRAYWSLPPTGGDGPAAQERCERELLPLLEDAVDVRTDPTSPWGILLSGGTDSSALAALAVRLGRSPVRTFSIDFPDAWKGTEVDAHYARLVAGRLGTEHQEFMATADEYYAVLDELAWHVERPYNKAAATVYLLCRQLGSKVPAVLSGEGMDEMLAGYAGARGLGLDGGPSDAPLAHLPWAPYSDAVFRLLSADFRTRVRAAEITQDRLAACLAATAGADPLDRALHLYMTYFLVDLLELHEQCAAAAGVRIRLPFLDRRVVELLTPLPSALKLQGGETKYVFKKVMGDLIPPEVRQRRKTHLPMPRDPRALEIQRNLARALLLGGESRTARYYERQPLEAFLEGRQAGADALTRWQVTMNLLTLELVHRRFKL